MSVPNLSLAIGCDRSVPYLQLQVAIVNILQFSGAALGAEMLSLRLQDLLFTGTSIDSPVIGVLPINKNRKRSKTYFRWIKGVDISIFGLSDLIGWL